MKCHREWRQGENFFGECAFCEHPVIIVHPLADLLDAT